MINLTTTQEAPVSQQCATCSSQCPDGAKFCLECGKPFARRCPSCGHPVTGGKFCMECGTPLTSASAAPPAPSVPVNAAPVSERRTTTVLFGDLVAFTTLSESRDPEEVRELLSSYFATAQTVVGRYGGTIEKFIGDAVMAVWGVPVSHEDDAERAVRAGLDLVAEVVALGASVGAPELSMRVGIVTGSVAVTLGATNEGMVAGDAVNTAARVQTAAAPGTVWVDQETRGLTAAAIAYADMGEHALKGKAEPARLFRADAIVAAVGGAQRVDGLEAPMTGRDAEMRRVKELFHATEDDGRSRLALVTGVAGVGKSRLGWEFEKYADGLSYSIRWHRGRCLSYGDGVAFWAFAEMARSRLGLLEGGDRSQVRARVRAEIDALTTTPDEAYWMTPRIEALLGVGDGASFERPDLFSAWTAWLDLVGAGNPVVLVFEDMQHADSGLLDLLEHLLEASTARLFVLVLARPELLAQRPSLAAGRRSTVVELAPLPDEAMSTVVDGLVHDLPDAARSAIVDRSEGIPLYAVETVRSLIDRDAVLAQDGRYVFVDHDHTRVDLAQLAAPTSLQTLIAARLDTLTPTERRTVQDASVLGMSFTRPGLVALADVGGAEVDEALAGLVRKGIVETQDDPRSPERGQYRFLQALVREVAHGTLARKDRRARHLAAAAHLESEDPEVAASVSAVIGRHLLDALDASTPEDSDREVITTRARIRLTTGASRALALGSPIEALNSVRIALRLGPSPLETAELQELGANAAWGAGLLSVGEAYLIDAVAGYGALGRTSEQAGAIALQAEMVASSGRAQEALELTDVGLELVRVDGGIDRRVHVDLLDAKCLVLRALGETEERLRVSLEVIRLAEQLGDPAALINALIVLGVALVDSGSPSVYEALMEKALAVSREHHVVAGLARSLTNLISSLYPRDLSSAADLAEEALVACRAVGDVTRLEVTLTNAGFTWRLSGEWDRLLRETDDWLTDREYSSRSSALVLNRVVVEMARGDATMIPPMPDFEDPWENACVAIARGLNAMQHDRADQESVAALTAVRAAFAGGSWEDFEMLWAPAVELQLAAGDLGAARELMSLANPLGPLSQPLTRGEVPRVRGLVAIAAGEDPEVYLRDAEAALEAYGASYLLARTRLELGRWLHTQGRVSEALPLLTAAREVFVGLRATPSVEEVDAVTTRQAVPT